MLASLMTVRLGWHIEKYAASHQSRPNQVLHFFGIPVIAISSLGLLAKISFSGGPIQPDAGLIALFAVGIWYFRQGFIAALVISLGLIACYLMGKPISPLYLWIAFGSGVLAHIVGHYVFEHKPPLLLSRPIAILEAPAWLLGAISAPSNAKPTPLR